MKKADFKISSKANTQGLREAGSYLRGNKRTASGVDDLASALTPASRAMISAPLTTSPLAITLSRARRVVVCMILGLVLGFAPVVASEPAPTEGRVGWARLITPGSLWSQHRDNDSYIADFMRKNVGVAMDTMAASADPANLPQLCSYPLIFVNNLETVQDTRQRENLGEYLRRGGFLFIDPCILPRFTPHPSDSLQHHREIMTSLLPDCVMRPLGPDHEIFRCFFLIGNRPPVDERARNAQYPGWDGLGIYGFYVGDRMVALLSMCNLQCGWGSRPAPSGHVLEMLEMISNIYVYAMTRTSDPTKAEETRAASR